MDINTTTGKSVGIVETRKFTFESFTFRSGRTLGPVSLAYETYGTLNAQKNNAILLTHALSGSAHAAGYHSSDDKHPGWWDLYVGPGKPFDTDIYYIICSNVIGGCNGSTGPSSINPETGRPYGLDFPMVTIHDMVNCQWHLVRHLGIDRLLSIAGGSMGGMQALKWSIMYPDMVGSVISIATSASLSAQGIALNEVGRQAIMNDPNWNGGNYYGSKGPDAGLSLARMIGHITYLSEKHMHEKFGRRYKDEDPTITKFDNVFMVESYLHYQGTKFVDRFDANTYLYITKAIDYFDLKKDYGTLHNAFSSVKSNFLIISFTSDWLYPSSQSKEIVQALRANGKNVMYTDIETDMGHDTFLIDYEPLKRNITNFLKREYERVKS
ncbi:MAG TPA: homoserine O-acetyltransferase [Spirochaetota bacterium]|nr:homoserine O-acetyltransferase [Spirochaetota bacterium]HPL17545.1 homoserine O-acetyltransferase [Spirochaetota bacterium]HQF06855.1 homoserine O-acetyltransferase [Spirochaetota bacterium]HQH95526.1 homoserine O-acetyltransferase [Spirochaetota bacterium]HQJ69104.1 homoserine O-acetyltransferase [Spirochaetota bacterium]